MREREKPGFTESNQDNKVYLLLPPIALVLLKGIFTLATDLGLG